MRRDLRREPSRTSNIPREVLELAEQEDQDSFMSREPVPPRNGNSPEGLRGQPQAQKLQQELYQSDDPDGSECDSTATEKITVDDNGNTNTKPNQQEAKRSTGGDVSSNGVQEKISKYEEMTV